MKQPLTPSILLQVVFELRGKLIISFISLILSILLFSIISYKLQHNHDELVKLHSLNNSQFQSWYQLSERIQFIIERPNNTPLDILQQIFKDMFAEIELIEQNGIAISQSISQLKGGFYKADTISALKLHTSKTRAETEFLQWTKNALQSEWVIKNPEEIKLTRPVSTIGLVRKIWAERLGQANSILGVLVNTTHKTISIATFSMIGILLALLVGIFYYLLRPALKRLHVAADETSRDLMTANALTSLVEEISSEDHLFKLDKLQIQQKFTELTTQHKALAGLNFEFNKTSALSHQNQYDHALNYIDMPVSNEFMLRATVTAPLDYNNLNLRSSLAAIANHLNSAIEMKLRFEAEQMREFYFGAMRTSFDFIPQLIAVFNIDGRLIFSNNPFNNFLELDALDAETALDLGVIRKQHQKFIDFTRQNESSLDVFNNNDANETTVTYLDQESLLWARVPIQDLGQLFIGQNVTLLKREVTKIEQQRRFEYLGKFSSRTAHDSNNFLAIIMNSLELIQQNQQLEPKAQSLLNQAIEACITIANRNDELLRFTRQQNLTPGKVTPDRIVTEIKAFVQTHKNVKLESSVNPRAVAWADVDNLMSLLLNVVKNSLEAMEFRGTITLFIDFDLTLDMIAYRVTDSGPGFTDESLLYASVPYYSTKELGTGLGLAAAQMFAEASEGLFNYDNSESGTWVELKLPRFTDQQATDGEVVITMPANDNPDNNMILTPSEPIRVLLVEDNGQLAKILTDRLTWANFDVTQVYDVSSAETAISDKNFDYLICDIILNDGMGFDVAEQLLGKNPDIKIIYITGYGTSRFQELLKKAPGEVLKKPFRIEELTRLIERQEAPSSAKPGEMAADGESDSKPPGWRAGQATLHK